MDIPINEQRRRAMELLIRKQGDSKYLLIDYAIDDEVRRVFAMPDTSTLSELPAKLDAIEKQIDEVLEKLRTTRL